MNRTYFNLQSNAFLERCMKTYLFGGDGRVFPFLQCRWIVTLRNKPGRLKSNFYK
uniref:Uncharacterized protein n=1 Tax=Anguilla anguilla TaxID=7936 RepID=A0A0E9RSD8_ANGAN